MPGGADVNAGSGRLDDLSVMKTEIERIGLFTFDDGDKRGRECLTDIFSILAPLLTLFFPSD